MKSPVRLSRSSVVKGWCVLSSLQCLHTSLNIGHVNTVNFLMATNSSTNGLCSNRRIPTHQDTWLHRVFDVFLARYPQISYNHMQDTSLCQMGVFFYTVGIATHSLFITVYFILFSPSPYQKSHYVYRDKKAHYQKYNCCCKEICKDYKSVGYLSCHPCSRSFVRNSS